MQRMWRVEGKAVLMARAIATSPSVMITAGSYLKVEPKWPKAHSNDCRSSCRTMHAARMIVWPSLPMVVKQPSFIA